MINVYTESINDMHFHTKVYQELLSVNEELGKKVDEKYIEVDGDVYRRFSKRFPLEFHSVSITNGPNDSGGGGCDEVAKEINRKNTSCSKKNNNSKEMFGDMEFSKVFGLVDGDNKDNSSINHPADVKYRIVRLKRYSFENFLYDPFIFCLAIGDEAFDKQSGGIFDKIKVKRDEVQKAFVKWKLKTNNKDPKNKDPNNNDLKGSQLGKRILEFYELLLFVMKSKKHTNTTIEDNKNNEIQNDLTQITVLCKKDGDDQYKPYTIEIPKNFLSEKGHNLEILGNGFTKKAIEHLQDFPFLPLDLVESYLELNEKVLRKVLPIVNQKKAKELVERLGPTCVIRNFKLTDADRTKYPLLAKHKEWKNVKPFSILIGKNGVGKSQVLKYIEEVMKSYGAKNCKNPKIEVENETLTTGDRKTRGELTTDKVKIKWTIVEGKKKVKWTIDKDKIQNTINRGKIEILTIHTDKIELSTDSGKTIGTLIVDKDNIELNINSDKIKMPTNDKDKIELTTNGLKKEIMTIDKKKIELTTDGGKAKQILKIDKDKIELTIDDGKAIQILKIDKKKFELTIGGEKIKIPTTDMDKIELTIGEEKQEISLHDILNNEITIGGKTIQILNIEKDGIELNISDDIIKLPTTGKGIIELTLDNGTKKEISLDKIFKNEFTIGGKTVQILNWDKDNIELTIDDDVSIKLPNGKDKTLMPILILDQPIANLDDKGFKTFYNVLNEQHGIQIFLATNHIESLSNLPESSRIGIYEMTEDGNIRKQSKDQILKASKIPLGLRTEEIPIGIYNLIGGNIEIDSRITILTGLTAVKGSEHLKSLSSKIDSKYLYDLKDFQRNLNNPEWDEFIGRKFNVLNYISDLKSKEESEKTLEVIKQLLKDVKNGKSIETLKDIKIELSNYEKILPSLNLSYLHSLNTILTKFDFSYEARIITKNKHKRSIVFGDKGLMDFNFSFKEVVILNLALLLFQIEHLPQEERSKNIVLLFDSPDLYLHPECIQEFIDILKKFIEYLPSFKVIMTTHRKNLTITKFTDDSIDKNIKESKSKSPQISKTVHGKADTT